MRVTLLAAAVLLSVPAAAVSAPAPATAPKASTSAAPQPLEKAVSTEALPKPSDDAAADDEDAADGDPSGNLDAVQEEDAIGIQEDLNAGKKELEDLHKAESQAIDQAPSAPQHLNRLGPANPLGVRTYEAAHAGGNLFDAAPPAPEGDAGGMLAELNGLDLAALKAEYDIPIEINDDVIDYIRFFQGPGRKWYAAWLARSHKWIPLMRPILAEEGVPLDLVYLAMIESGFSPFAYSPARASGFWQFISETGRRYGLRDDFWTDERRDPLLSTRAAARYLKEMHDRLGDWYLSWASYNAGEGRVNRAIRRTGSHDFWHIAHSGRLLMAETKHYVPKLIAAAIIAKHPDRFGFGDVQPEGPFNFDEVEVPDAVDLQVLAKVAQQPVEVLQQLNPELRRWCTPPAKDGQGYVIRLPKGTKEELLADIDKVAPSERLTFRYHRVEHGETIGAIARKFSTDANEILRMNGIASARKMKPGADLIIPLSTELAENFPDHGTSWREPRGHRRRHHSARYYSTSRRHISHAERAVASSGAYRVRGGDTLWSIAQRFGVNVEQLRRWNRLSKSSNHGLQVGRTIRVGPSRG